MKVAIATTLTSMASLSQTLQCNNNQRDPSFSSFLNTEEETIIRKLAESRQDLNNHRDHIHLNRHQYHAKKDGDEIGVFGAEKYFEGRIDPGDSRKLAATIASVSGKYHQPKRDEHQTTTPDRLVNPESRLGTPSVRSESSCNSQTALVRGPLIRTLSRKRTNRVQGKSLLAAFRCNFCSCSDKGSVDVHDELRKPATDRDPVSIQDDHHQDKPKFLKPQEVFGKANSFGPEKKLPRDFLAPRKEEQAGVSAPSGGGYEEEEEESDGSSDLFEIESISGKVTSGCLTPTTCYAPQDY